VSRIYLPEPHENQRPILDSEARFKLVRAGRRFGKDRLSLPAAVIGHGKGKWRGIAQGVDVAWIGPDFPQIRAIWREEVEPRFRGVPGVDLNQAERRISFRGLGTLEFRSAENIDSIRGRKLGGVVLNEAAYFDLEYAFREVVMPSLIDLGGWAIIDSTPNAGPDGHVNEHGKRSPSYFNMLCERDASGELGADWEHWHHTSYDNPKIPRSEIDALVAEYPPDSPALQQEIFAKLIAAGAGVAFPEWDESLHVTKQQPERLSGEWRWSASGDWGFAKPGWLGLFATTEEYSVCRWEFYFRETAPYQVGFTFGQRIRQFPRPEWVVLDSACWNVTDGGPTIAEQFQHGLEAACGRTAPPVISAPKGSGSRVASKLLVHEALRYTREADGTVKQWNRPKLMVHEDCRDLIRTLPRLPRDEKNPEDVDTDAEDHPYDGLRYWLLARKPEVEVECYEPFTRDLSYGFTKQGEKVKPWDRSEELVTTGPRYQRPPKGDEGGNAW
jgi:hypothetical protein